MAKPGAREGTRTTSWTRSALIAAGRQTLIEEGFARTSARSIASRAGCSQASVFYHFSGVPELLLAVMDEISDRRMAAYRDQLLAARTPGQLLRLGRRIADADLASGDLRVLVEMVAGAPTVPGLKAQVAARIDPWEELVAEVAARFLPRPLRSVLSPGTAAHAVVAGFLGLEMLRDLRDDGSATQDVLDGIEQVGLAAGAAADPAGTS